MKNWIFFAALLSGCIRVSLDPPNGVEGGEVGQPSENPGETTPAVGGEGVTEQPMQTGGQQPGAAPPEALPPAEAAPPAPVVAAPVAASKAAAAPVSKPAKKPAAPPKKKAEPPPPELKRADPIRIGVNGKPKK